MKSCLLTTSLLFMLLNAAPGTNAAEAAEPEPVTSVIEKLDADKESFEQLFATVLSPAQAKVRDAFQESIRSLEKKLLTVRGDPTNARLKADYEEALSKALLDGAALLQEFSQLRDPADRQCARLLDSVTAAVQVCEDEVAASRRLKEEYRAGEQQLSQQLADLAEKYKTILEGDGELPDEVDFQIQLLQVDIDVQRQQAELTEVAEAEYGAALDSLTGQARDLRALRSELDVLFKKADGQTLLLKEVARLKSIRGNAGQLAGDMKRMNQSVAKAREKLSSVNGLVSQLLRREFFAPDGKPVKSDAAAPRLLAGREILKRYVKRESAIQPVSATKSSTPEKEVSHDPQ